MYLFAISLVFAVFFPLLKLTLTNHVTEYEYTLLVTVWSLSSLIGSQLIGSYPRLYPKNTEKFKVLNFDYFSFFISIIIFIVFILYYKSVFASLMLFSCILIVGIYELYSYESSINRNYKGLFFCEIINILPLVSLMVLLLLFNFKNNFAVISIVYLFFFICFFAFSTQKLSFTFGGNRVEKDYNQSKLALFFSQSNAHLVPVVVGLLYLPEVSVILMVLYYVLSLPASLNQLLINRVLYSTNTYSINKLTLVILLIFAEALCLFYAFEYSLLDKLIAYEFSVGFLAIFVFLMSRMIYTVLFVKSRFSAISGRIMNKLEIFRLCLMIALLYIGQNFYGSNEAFLYSLSLSIILFSIILSIILRKK